MSISASIQAFAMWDTLYTSIKNEAAPTKRLAPLVDVRKSAQLARGTGPCCAVQLTAWQHVAPYGTRRQELDVEFKIMLGAPSIGVDGTTTARDGNLDDAMASLRAVVDDGNGNGLVAVLNDPATFALGGNAMQSRLGDAHFDWDLRAGPTQTVWAYFLQIYTARTIVSY